MNKLPKTHQAVGITSTSSGVALIEVPTFSPGPDELLVRVLWSFASSIDLWQVDFGLIVKEYPVVLGGNIVGEVLVAGENVDFNAGDKIMSFSLTESPKGKAFQEYAVLSKWNVGRLPINVTPREAVTVPGTFVAAYWTLFGELKLPVPTELPSLAAPQDASEPILVWGAGGSTGQYMLQILRLAGYKRVFAVASARHHEFLRSLGASDTFDYSAADVAEQIVRTAGGKIKVVVDAIGDEEGSLRHISKVVGEGSKVAYLLPVRVGGQGAVQAVKFTTDLPFPSGVELIGVRTHFYQSVEQFKRELQPKLVPQLIADGLIKPNRVREIQGASLLERVREGVDILRRGEVSGDRLVFRVSDSK